MSNVTPLISIGIPTYNRANKLKKCLNSVLQQSYNNIEVIISDNMSSDATPEVCRDFMRQDQRIKTYRQTENIKGAPNFNFVRQKFTGAYFMVLGDDDWIDPLLIQSCVTFLEDHPDYIAASGQTMYYRENNVKFKGVSLSIQSNNPSTRLINTISQVVDAGTFYALYRAEITNDIPYLNVWGMDYYFLCEVAFQGKIITLDEVACHRNDNSHLRSIKEFVDREGHVDGQETDPYGVIASIMFWRIIVGGDIFKKLPDYDKLSLAAEVVKIVSDRWQIIGEPNLLNIAIRLFSDKDLLAKYYDLRTQIMSKWLLASKLSKNPQWYFTRKILRIFNQLSFVSPPSNLEDGKMVSEIMRVSGTIDDRELKTDAKQILNLFT